MRFSASSPASIEPSADCLLAVDVEVDWSQDMVVKKRGVQFALNAPK